MIVNLYADHLMSQSPASAEEVWNATQEHPRVMAAAANQIGLTPAEYKEFKTRLLDGKAVYVQLPRRMDAMSGRHDGHVYAVKNAVMRESVMGWRVALADGTDVYVPQICGNMSMVRHTVVAYVPHGRPIVYGHVHRTAAVAYVPAIATQPVEMTPPAAPPAPVAVSEAPAPAAAPVTVASGNASPFYLFIPAAIFGALAGIHHDNTPSYVPPCSQGSNSQFVCSK
jgi:hypothetical protein